MLLLRKDRDDADLFTIRIPGMLRKIAHKKYREMFAESLAAIRELKQRRPVLFKRIAGKIDEIEELAAKRFKG